MAKKGITHFLNAIEVQKKCHVVVNRNVPEQRIFTHSRCKSFWGGKHSLKALKIATISVILEWHISHCHLSSKLFIRWNIEYTAIISAVIIEIV